MEAAIVRLNKDKIKNLTKDKEYSTTVDELSYE